MTEPEAVIEVIASLGEAVSISIGDLLLDAENPRSLVYQFERLRTKHRFIKNFSRVPDWDEA